jgi:molybdate transport system substrate-binding protein
VGRSRLLFVAGVVALAAASCSAGNADEELIVSAASSLTDAFTEVAAAFESANPDVDVVLNFGGSASLREQILGGAPVSVFASANPQVMAEVVSSGVTESPPVVFARNSMTIAVPVDNPAGVVGLEDFADPDLLLGVCAPGVPCGDYAARVLDRAGVVASVDTEEPDVRALLTKLEAGELDAGIVYVTDVAAAGGVTGIAIAPGVNVVAEYPLVVLEGPAATAADMFVAFVQSATGRSILETHGFDVP